ncbi:hypothetical protein M3223_08540 [Paenibacillus pasadenensis]|uniref:hypothetical protein n=1 Tax=Paenibacillus pasadenensis TaxID=217090 RepID=UPI0020407767|nr:hypothetical protein [Paenibacillus pasadenensis]MCM3747400.1 hypothetical protein [Paenibacillus pasadenensis]
MRAGAGIRMAAAGAAAVGAILLLAVVPFHADMFKGDERAVFRTELPTALGHTNLVDELQELQLSEKLRRVDWNGSVLKIELNRDAESSSDILLRDDLLKLARLSFVRSSNVSRLLVRLDTPEGTHIAAADLRRTDAWITPGELRDWSGINLETDPFWQERLRLVFFSPKEAPKPL